MTGVSPAAAAIDGSSPGFLSDQLPGLIQACGLAKLAGWFRATRSPRSSRESYAISTSSSSKPKTSVLSPRSRSGCRELLPLDLTRDETAKQRFLQDAQVASALDHTNICTTHEINEILDRQHFLIARRTAAAETSAFTVALNCYEDLFHATSGTRSSVTL